MNLLNSKIIIEVIEHKRPAKKEKAVIFQSIKRKKSEENQKKMEITKLHKHTERETGTKRNHKVT